MLILFGLIDAFGAIALVAAVLGFPLPYLQAAAALGLLLKGGLFIGDLFSILDICAGIAMFFLLWSSSPLISIIIVAYLVIKAVSTFTA
jgi:hypothetical protein